MSERYQRLLTLPENIYADGSPLIIAAGALLKDTVSGKVLLQLKLRSISDKTVKAAYVGIAPLDTTGKALGETIEHQYLDLSVSRDGEFGSKNAIFMPDNTTRGVTVRVTRVIYTDNTEWSNGDAEWSPLAYTQLPLAKMLGSDELADEYRLKYTDKCEHEPKKVRDLWACSCGHINPQTDDKCKSCGASLAAMLALDMDALKASCQKRLERERAEAEAQAQADAKERRRNTIIAAIAAPLLIALIIIVTWFATETDRVESKARAHMANGDLAAAMEVLVSYNKPEKTAALRDEIEWEMHDEIDDHITYDRNAEAMATIKLYEKYIDTTQLLKQLQYWCEHQYIDGEVVMPTCTEKGYSVHTCSVCEYVLTQYIPEKGHSVGEAPTCTKASVCDECGEVLEEMLPHRYSAAPSNGNYDKAPTCTEEGWWEQKCLDCGHVEKVPVAKIPHDFTSVITKAATCTAEGERTNTCRMCQKTETESIPMIAHDNIEKIVKAATCTAEGVKQTTCRVCGKTDASAAIEKIPHSYQSITIKAATCSAEGLAQNVCRVCGEKQNATATAKLAHSFVDQIIKPATCTEAGTRNSTCTVCGHVEKSAAINALGHNYTSKVTVQPTCTTDGTRVYNCQRCGHSYNETIAALGHAWKDATCTTAKSCSRCGTTSGDALGHYWESFYSSTIKCNRCRIDPPKLSVNIICNDLPLSYNNENAKITIKSIKMNPIRMSAADGKLKFSTYNIQMDAEITRVNPQAKSASMTTYLCVDIYDTNGNYIVGHRPKYLGYTLSSSQSSKTDTVSVTSADQNVFNVIDFDNGGTYVIKVYFKN